MSVEIDVWLLAPLFLAVSFVYAAVGLGGGSSYTALLAIAGVSHVVLPTISLSLNAIVSAMGAWNFARRGHLRLELLAPFLITSMPMAWLGGTLAVPRAVFLGVLLIALLLVAARIYLWPDPAILRPPSRRVRVLASLAIGAVLGLVAGIVGIGGGIFLVPLIIVLGLGDTREAAAAGAWFVLLNALVGLAARIRTFDVPLQLMLPLTGAVIIGGGLGSYLGAGWFRARTVQRLLGLVILAAAGLLAWRLALSC